MNLDLVARSQAGILQPAVDRGLISPDVGWDTAAFVVFWEAQAQAASLAYVALVAFFSIWIALGAMLAWSLLATIFFFSATERGYPNILSSQPRPKKGFGVHLIWFALGSVFRMWLAGINAFVFARCSSCLVKEHQGCGIGRRALRLFSIVVGLTMFGVSTAEHILRAAGYRGAKLTRLGLVGPFLNVPYRVLLSAALVAIVQDTVGIL